MKIGITGGMGCGKTYVSTILKKQGFPVYNCDDRARRLMKEDETIKSAVVELIGENAYTETGDLDKAVISQFIYSDEENRKKLNAIVHPRVKSDFLMWCNFQDSDVMFMECALLYESAIDDVVDKVLYVYASDEVRIHRIIKRDRINRTEAYLRMKSQMPEAEKMKRADFCIINNGNNNVLRQLHNIQI